MKESDVISLINELFSTNLEHTERYNRFDGIDHTNKVLCEVKGRNIPSNKYLTTMIGCNKINYAERIYPDYKIILVFDFTDGLFYYIYDKEDKHYISTTTAKKTAGEREDKLYYYIHKKHLEKISTECKYEL